jgi:N-acetylmuramoyl-L-alanine amidase
MVASRASSLGLGILLALLAQRAARAELVLVLDPGHGGSNTGARSPSSGAVEKRLTLEIASRTAVHLRLLYPRATIVLTRSRDEYLTLDERVRRANAARADLFVSLHLNASESQSEEGFETFFLSREASDHEAARLASVENEPRARPASSHSATPVDAILGDLRQVAAHAASARLAASLQKTLRDVRGARRDRGVRQAAFDVLLGLRMPAALVEVGFIDHPVEGPGLVEPGALEPISLAVAAGIVDFIERMRAPAARTRRPH